LHEPGNDAIARVEVYNLDRARDYSGYRVYWLARASNEESLNLLRGLVEGPRATKVNEHATMAIARHDDPRVSRILKNFVQQSKVEQMLKDTVDKADGDTEIQKQAVFAISQRPKDEAVPLLIKIAQTHSKGEIRKQAIFWLGQTGDERAVDFFKEILLK